MVKNQNIEEFVDPKNFYLAASQSFPPLRSSLTAALQGSGAGNILDGQAYSNDQVIDMVGWGGDVHPFDETVELDEVEYSDLKYVHRP